jgi:P-type Ca2+ transporter type 2C
VTATERPAPQTSPPESPRWHVLPATEVAHRLDVDPHRGLDAAEVGSRTATHGPNRLAEAQRRPAWLRFLDQFRNFLILILITAAVVSLFVSDSLTTPIVILVVVVLNAVLGFVQENRAERSLEALKQMLVLRARARRGGEVVEVPAEELVPGDVVLVEAGDRVPADGRVLLAANLEAEEAALTGESAPVAKSAEVLDAEDLPLGDRTNSLYMNTTITRGRGELLVTGTGMATEVGKIAGLLRSTLVEKTPLQKQLDYIARVITALAGVVVVLVFAIGLVRGQSFADLFLTAVALAVASVPEGLPAVLAVTLAIGAHRMAKRNAIVKQLASVETLGSTSVICSDKTGTLTLNQMTARALVVRDPAGGPLREIAVDGQGYDVDGELRPAPGSGTVAPEVQRELLTAMALCSDAVVRDGQLVGDPTEGALVVAAVKGGVDVDAVRAALPRLAELPFDSATKLMATLHRVSVDGREVDRLYVKGAPDVLLARSSATAEEIRALEETNERLAATGLRVLAVAARDLDPAAARQARDDDGLADLVTDVAVLGLIGILDPPRPEARDAIALCRRAGVTVKMITGDHAATAAAIAGELGIRGRAVTGAELDRMTPDELAAQVDEIGVFARVAPEHKLTLVKVLQQRGNVVAMTGDGVNDAPALRQADIGVAMGITGTEVTKEAATMVLADDNFATIIEAVRRGRTIYDNIVKFVRFQLSTVLGFGLTFLTAAATGIAAGAPFTALQILWVNIIMDGPPAMALGVDPPARDTMNRGPRSINERILMPARLAKLVFFGVIMAVGSLGVLVTSPDYVTGVNLDGTVGMTMAFTTFVFFQFFNLLNARNEFVTALGRHTLTNRNLWGSVAVVIMLHVAVVYVPFLQEVFGTTALTAGQWLICIGVASSILWIEELRKLIARRVLPAERRPAAAPAAAAR